MASPEHNKGKHNWPYLNTKKGHIVSLPPEREERASPEHNKGGIAPELQTNSLHCGQITLITLFLSIELRTVLGATKIGT